MTVSSSRSESLISGSEPVRTDSFNESASITSGNNANNSLGMSGAIRRSINLVTNPLSILTSISERSIVNGIQEVFTIGNAVASSAAPTISSFLGALNEKIAPSDISSITKSLDNNIEYDSRLSTYINRKREDPALITMFVDINNVNQSLRDSFRDASLGWKKVQSEGDPVIQGGKGRSIPILLGGRSAFGGGQQIGATTKAPDLGNGDLYSYTTDEFILRQVSRPDNERYQILETFGDPIAVFYGRRPKVYRFECTLINTRTHNWRDLFWRNYEDYFRGTKIAENNIKMVLTFDRIQLEGAMLSMNVSDSGDEPNSVSMSFDLFVVDEVPLAIDHIDVIDTRKSPTTDTPSFGI